MASKEQVSDIFKQTQDEINTQVDYYKKAANNRRNFSFVLRLITALSVVGGTMAPFIAALQPEGDKSYWLGWGYALLGFAGLMLVVDQFFLVTRGWGRYTKAKLSLEFLMKTAKFEQIRFEMIATDEAKLAEILPATLEKIVKIREELKSTVTTETDSWETDQSQAIKALESKLSATTTSTLTDLEKQRVKEKSKLGAVKITIETKQGVKIDAATITLGEVAKPLSKPFTGPVAFDDVLVGISTIRLAWKTGDEERRQEKPVLVKEGEIAESNFIIEKAD